MIVRGRNDDRIEVKPRDNARQKQAMKKAGETVPAPTRAGGGKKRGAKGGRRSAGAQPILAAAGQRKPAAASAPSSNPVDLIDNTLDLAHQCRGVAALEPLVDWLPDMQRW
jgi:hypothetical protein